LRLVPPPLIIPVEHTTGVITVEEDAKTPDHLMELPKETRRFLAQLRDDDLETLKDGLPLIDSIRTVDVFMKWLIVFIAGTFDGGVMIRENVLKVIRFLTPELPN
jgi:hypothetical protein